MPRKQERALNTEVTALSLVCGALFPVLAYDSTLALVFGLPGTPVPTGSAYSKARARSGEAPARAMFFHDAARTDIPTGGDGFAFGLEVTAIDGTTLELFNDPVLAGEFGVPSPGAKPLLRVVGLLHAATRRWKAAVVGRYLDEENALADGLEEYLGPCQLNLADRGFFSMDRWIRFAATGAHLLWRVKNGAKCAPFKTLQVLKDGSELVLLWESSGIRTRRRKNAGDSTLPYLPDTVARLVRFTVLTRTRSGRAKSTQVRLLTTLLDPDLYPAAGLAALYAKRWIIEIAFLHLRKAVRGARRTLRARSAELARQEARALLLAAWNWTPPPRTPPDASSPLQRPRGPAVTWTDNRAFLNKPADTATGLTEIGSREYDPAVGQFTSPDPVLNISDPQDLNPYAYADGNPVTHSDPTGLMVDPPEPAGSSGSSSSCPVFDSYCAPASIYTPSPSGSSGDGSVITV